MSKPLSRDTLIRRNDSFLTGDMDGEVVMVSIERGSYHSLNPTGGRIWEILETPTRLGRVLDILSEEYEVDLEELTRETFRFVEEMLERGAVRVDGPQDP